MAEPRGETHGAPPSDSRRVARIFLGRSFPSAKRFGLEGGLALVPGLQAMVESFAARGTEQLVVGMAHRGRLNILNAVFDKPLAATAPRCESEGDRSTTSGRAVSPRVRHHRRNQPPWEIQTRNLDGGDAVADEDDPFASSSSTKTTTMDLSMAPNPSHLRL